MFKTSRYRMRMKVGVCDKRTQWRGPFWGPEKNKVAVSALCVWCGRDSVCQIPFPLAKEKLPSPTHTPDVLPTSASWDTHTLGFPSPRRCTHPRSCKLQDSKQIFSAQDGRRPLASFDTDVRWKLLPLFVVSASSHSSEREKRRIFKELIRGGLWRPTSHSSQKLSHVRSHLKSGYVLIESERSDMTFTKIPWEIKDFLDMVSKVLHKHFITMLPPCPKNMNML